MSGGAIARAHCGLKSVQVRHIPLTRVLAPAHFSSSLFRCLCPSPIGLCPCLRISVVGVGPTASGRSCVRSKLCGRGRPGPGPNARSILQDTTRCRAHAMRNASAGNCRAPGLGSPHGTPAFRPSAILGRFLWRGGGEASWMGAQQGRAGWNSGPGGQAGQRRGEKAGRRRCSPGRLAQAGRVGGSIRTAAGQGHNVHTVCTGAHRSATFVPEILETRMERGAGPTVGPGVQANGTPRWSTFKLRPLASLDQRDICRGRAGPPGRAAPGEQERGRRRGRAAFMAGRLHAAVRDAMERVLRGRQR